MKYWVCSILFFLACACNQVADVQRATHEQQILLNLETAYELHPCHANYITVLKAYERYNASSNGRKGCNILSEEMNKIAKLGKVHSELQNHLYNLTKNLKPDTAYNDSTNLPKLLKTEPVRRFFDKNTAHTLDKKLRAFEKMASAYIQDKDLMEKISFFRGEGSLHDQFFKDVSVITALQGLAQLQIEAARLFDTCLQKSMKIYSSNKHLPIVSVEKSLLSEGEEYVAKVSLLKLSDALPIAITCNGEKVPINKKGVGEIRLKPTTVGKHRWKGKIQYRFFGEIINADIGGEFEVLPNE